MRAIGCGLLWSLIGRALTSAFDCRRPNWLGLQRAAAAETATETSIKIQLVGFLVGRPHWCVEHPDFTFHRLKRVSLLPRFQILYCRATCSCAVRRQQWRCNKPSLDFAVELPFGRHFFSVHTTSQSHISTGLIQHTPATVPHNVGDVVYVTANPKVPAETFWCRDSVESPHCCRSQERELGGGTFGINRYSLTKFWTCAGKTSTSSRHQTPLPSRCPRRRKQPAARPRRV